jgi:ubiquinone/menaquinone biosynthesis C-methylase UbiE
MTSEYKNTFGNAKAYEIYVGRWSRLVAKQFIAWLNPVPEKIWLDVGAGTGILSQVILQDASPAKVVALDSSEDYLHFAREQRQDSRLEYRLGDALNLPFEASIFDIAVSGLVLNFLPDPPQAVKEMRDAVKAGGIVAAYLWDYSGKMEMMRQFWDAASVIDPKSKELDGGNRFAIADPKNLRATFESFDLEAVETTPIDVETRFKDFEDYWQPFLAAQGSVGKYLQTINEETLLAIREQLRQQLPKAEDGAIPLIARAWAVKGTKRA